MAEYERGSPKQSANVDSSSEMSQDIPGNLDLLSMQVAEDTHGPGPRLGVIRIVVVATEGDLLGGASPMSVETTAGLARLGDPVELLRAQTADEIASIAADPSIDLFLFDRLEGEGAANLLAAIPSDGPPSVVVIDGDSEAAALEAFRSGASDCVHFGPEYETVLPVVLLEQVQRWRSERQRQVSEDRIRWLEDLYAAIVSEMPAGLVVIDADGLIVTENSEFGRLFPSRSSSSGIAAEFLAARLPTELVEAVDRAEQGESIRAPHFLELVRVDDAEQTARAYELRHSRLADSGRGLVVISDVTESEWLSERLEALRRDTRDIIGNINSALIVVDLGGRITFANPAAERILGGANGDLGGRQIEDWFGAGGAKNDVVNPIEACLESGTRSRGAETLLQRGDGQWIPVGVSCSPRFDADGRSHGVVAIFQDLSEIKELELQVRQSEKMASIGQLAAGVAHEVNNPMGFIHANLHQMSEYLGDLEKYFDATQRLQQAAIEGDLEVIRAAAADVAAVAREIDLEFVRSDFEKALLESGEGAERIRHIVKDLRDFSRPDLPARTSADVNQAVDSTANIVYTMMKHTVELEKAYGELPKIEAYPMQLKQVFMNLLVNAHQAIEARGEFEPGVIRIETAEVGHEIVVRISDTGVGISESDRSRIFDPFFTTKPVGAGTGLGLSTSFSIVERHGGRIVVNSEVGRGTVFEVWLPITAPRDESPVDRPDPLGR
jgi:PAS domain S-box-containing protein